ncbi:hypothetical protein ES754_06515 [Psychrobacter frigidicola]|uniref:Uncharacterized protein n=1 Tax=Psychrobacter frigidicola TaxID=45611 RepID=A0A5C7A4Q1_9GAMM|nr:hypothetical protein [Psychrobacter frigidicola]TXD98547.1 hypothetical protein ES754_06515 [Psychrobacter frigidicola]
MPIFSDNSERRTAFYKELQRREGQWWQSRQRLITLQEQQMFWFGDNSLIMWLLWQLVSYVVVAIVLMLLSKLFSVHLYLWQYLAVFGLQTLFFMAMFTAKGRLANIMQNNIDKADLVREQMLNEMVILASDSIFPDIHAHAPISLQQIHERYEAQLRLASLQCLLQKEIDAGRLLLSQQEIEARVLPPELAEDELIPHAGDMIYKSLVQFQ